MLPEGPPLPVPRPPPPLNWVAYWVGLGGGDASTGFLARFCVLVAIDAEMAALAGGYDVVGVLAGWVAVAEVGGG